MALNASKTPAKSTTDPVNNGVSKSLQDDNNVKFTMMHCKRLMEQINNWLQRCDQFSSRLNLVLPSQRASSLASSKTKTANDYHNHTNYSLFYNEALQISQTLTAHVLEAEALRKQINRYHWLTQSHAIYEEYDKILKLQQSALTKFNHLRERFKIIFDAGDSSSRFSFDRPVTKLGKSSSDTIVELADENNDDDDAAAASSHQLLIQSSTKAASDELSKQQFVRENLAEVEQDLFDLSSIYRDLHSIVAEQQEVLDQVETQINSANASVNAGRAELRIASRLRTGMFVPLLGALVGGAAFGPLGLLTGYKIAGAATLAVGTVVGWQSAHAALRRTQSCDDLPTTTTTPLPLSTSVQPNVPTPAATVAAVAAVSSSTALLRNSPTARNYLIQRISRISQFRSTSQPNLL